MRRIHARLLVGVALLALVLTGCGGSAYSFQGGVLEPESPASPIQLTDQHGNPFSLADQQGKIVFLYFGYTTCPDACPTTLSDWIEVKRLLGDRADKVEFVMVTVDPERDTNSVLKAYVDNFNAGFVGLRGSAEQTQQASREFKVFFGKVPGKTESSYTIDHTAGAYIFDPQGRIRLFSRYGAGPKALEEDIRALLRESA